MIDKIMSVIREHTGDESIIISENTLLMADLGFSSFDLVNLVCILEDEFDVEIPDRAIKEFKTVGDVIAFLECKSYVL